MIRRSFRPGSAFLPPRGVCFMILPSWLRMESLTNIQSRLRPGRVLQWPETVAGIFASIIQGKKPCFPMDLDLPMMRWPTGFAGNDDAARLWSFQQARESAEKVAHQLRGLFEQAYGKPDTTTHLPPHACEAGADTSITLADLRRVDQWRLVSCHRSNVVGCAQPSERSARRIAQPIPSVLASDATPRCASMASADRQMIGDATLAVHGGCGGV